MRRKIFLIIALFFLAGKFLFFEKLFAQKVDSSKFSEIRMVPSSPRSVIYATGKAKLNNGEVKVSFDRILADHIHDTTTLNVIITPIGSWSGIYIVELNRNGFTAKLGEGNPNAQFGWILVGEMLRSKVSKAKRY